MLDMIKLVKITNTDIQTLWDILLITYLVYWNKNWQQILANDTN